MTSSKNCDHARGHLVDVRRASGTGPNLFVWDLGLNAQASAQAGRIVLKPENKTYPVMRQKGELEIFGVVVG